MKNSKILKGLCYILIPILLLILCLSILYEYDYYYYSEELNYFETDDFLYNYMLTISNQAYNLIYRNNSYNSVIDNETNIKICYTSSSVYYRSIENYYYLIIYKNLAITNIELTTNTNTIEKLKNYIQNIDGKKSNIIDGNVQADSEIIETKALQYFDKFKMDYYSIEDEPIEEELYIEEESTEEVQDNVVTNVTSYQYYSTAIEDFNIYTTYEEQLAERSSNNLYQQLIERLIPCENIAIVAIPVCSVLLLVMTIYLIIAIGHDKDKKEIDLNDFDKLPIEILFVVLAISFIVFVAVLKEIFHNYITYFDLIISVLITLYFVTYIICMASLVTIIKRIKSKTLISSSICGRILKLIIKILKKISNKTKKIIKKVTENWNVSIKIIIKSIILILIISIILFSQNIFITVLLMAFIIYKTIEKIKFYSCYKKIEDHLKNMYEGKEVEVLYASDFAPIFNNIVKYINDISNGFENAKQEGIKSERMKTELITNVSHDIKTPLTSIINYVDLLKEENIKNKKAQEYIEVLDSKSQRLKKLTEDLVEASKASSGNVKLNIERINIIELIKQTTGEFEDRFKEKKLEIISNMPKEDIYINADSKYMYRIIENLFSNVSKYALDSSRVYIDVKNNKLKVKISIKNISKERLNISAEELMQRFVRGDKSRTTEGSGLGLSISQSLTELQNGTFALNVDGDLFKVELEFDIVK